MIGTHLVFYANRLYEVGNEGLPDNIFTYPDGCYAYHHKKDEWLLRHHCVWGVIATEDVPKETRLMALLHT